MHYINAGWREGGRAAGPELQKQHFSWEAPHSFPGFARPWWHYWTSAFFLFSPEKGTHEDPPAWPTLGWLWEPTWLITRGRRGLLTAWYPRLSYRRRTRHSWSFPAHAILPLSLTQIAVLGRRERGILACLSSPPSGPGFPCWLQRLGEEAGVGILAV